MKEKNHYTVQDIINIVQPTNDYLCKICDNVYNLIFTRFTLRNIDNDDIIIDITLTKLNKENEKYTEPISYSTINTDLSCTSTNLIDSNVNENDDYEVDDDSKNIRFVRYYFKQEFIDLTNIGASIEFKIGSKEINSMRMIEKLYFKQHHLKTFDFDFGYVIPNSTNTCEIVYSFPTVSDEMKKEMINEPWETKSDAFYFVNNQLIMHNKVEYSFT
ncbi:hypothetical protein A3Q56_04531 [Intoshia linei]|uniref:GMP phosphodiesterase delta subunit domain-containing protein n=1 Tax=Intoshia linei TaxID=1819745 RepID=A0A177B0F8_9BILA|nr:hypothetical protein A3Q56_04531 [Intoshia linei]